MRTSDDSQDPGHLYVVKWSASPATKPLGANHRRGRQTQQGHLLREDTASPWALFAVRHTVKPPANRHFSCTPLIPKTKCFLASVRQNKHACKSRSQRESAVAGRKQVRSLALTATCQPATVGPLHSQPPQPPSSVLPASPVGGKTRNVAKRSVNVRQCTG